MKLQDINSEALNAFVYDQLFIYPIKEIISNLENSKYTDESIVWLDEKINAYTDLALKVIGKDITFSLPNTTALNNHTVNRYLSYFKTLLDLFESVE